MALVLQCYTIVASPALHGLAYRGSVEGRERLGDGEKDRKRLRDGKREDVRREEKRLGEIKRN